MSEVGDGGPAFPRPYSQKENAYDKDKFLSQEGMSLRDYFATAALVHARMWAADGFKTNEEYITQAATIAYQVADAMLKKREGK